MNKPEITIKVVPKIVEKLSVSLKKNNAQGHTKN